MNKYAFRKKGPKLESPHPIQMIYDEWAKMGKPRFDLDTRIEEYDPEMVDPTGSITHPGKEYDELRYAAYPWEKDDSSHGMTHMDMVAPEREIKGGNPNMNQKRKDYYWLQLGNRVVYYL